MCDNNKIVIVIIMCSKLMFCSASNTLITVILQTYGALIGVHVLLAVVLKIKSESEAEKSPYGAKRMPCAFMYWP